MHKLTPEKIKLCCRHVMNFSSSFTDNSNGNVEKTRTRKSLPTLNIDLPHHKMATARVYVNCNGCFAPGGYSQKNLVGLCGPLSKTLTLFMTKICDFPTLFMTRPKIQDPIYDRCSWHCCPKHNFWRASVNGLIDNDEKVASSKNTPSSRLELKTIPHQEHIW